MKLALLLPGYLDSPDYLHLKTFEKRLIELGYVVERLDPCNLWQTGDTNKYTITNIIDQVKERVNFYREQSPSEIILIGHSMGGFTSIVAGNLIPEVTKIVALCPPSSIEELGKKWESKPSRISTRDLPNDRSSSREFNIPLTFVDDARKYSAIEIVHKIKKPLMILIAMADTAVAPDETEILVSNAIHPHVVRIEDMGHNFRFSQSECDLVMAEIEKFLNNSEGKPAHDK